MENFQEEWRNNGKILKSFRRILEIIFKKLGANYEKYFVKFYEKVQKIQKSEEINLGNVEGIFKIKKKKLFGNIVTNISNLARIL